MSNAWIIATGDQTSDQFDYADQLRRDPGVGRSARIATRYAGNARVCFDEDHVLVRHLGDWTAVADLNAAFHRNLEMPEFLDELLRAPDAARMARLVSGLKGDFSGCLVHHGRGPVVVFGDRFGSRPVYWAAIDGRLTAGNAPRVMRQALGDHATLQDEAVLDFLLFTAPQCPTDTVIRKLKRAEAGMVTELRVGASGVRLKRYQASRLSPRSTSLSVQEDAERALRDAMTASVRRRQPDGPFDILMSGGLDSTTTLATAHQLDCYDRIEGHTIDYGVTDDRGTRETEWARRAAAALGINCHVYPSPDLQSSTPTSIHTALPVAERRSSPQMHVIENVHNRGQSNLWTGHGGDGVFRASPGRLSALLRERSFSAIATEVSTFRTHHEGRPPLFIRRHLAAALKPRRRRSRAPGWIRPEWRYQFDLDDRMHELSSKEMMTSPLERVQKGVYWSNLMELADPLVLGRPIRVQAMFLADEILDVVSQMPEWAFLSRKWILRRAFDHLLPSDVLARPKQTTDVSADQRHASASSSYLNRRLNLHRRLRHVARWIDLTVVERALSRPAKLHPGDYALLETIEALSDWMEGWQREGTP